MKILILLLVLFTFTQVGYFSFAHAEPSVNQLHEIGVPGDKTTIPEIDKWLKTREGKKWIH